MKHSLLKYSLPLAALIVVLGVTACDKKSPDSTGSTESSGMSGQGESTGAKEPGTSGSAADATKPGETGSSGMTEPSGSAGSGSSMETPSGQPSYPQIAPGTNTDTRPDEKK